MALLCLLRHRWRSIGTKRCCLRCGEMQYLRHDRDGPEYWAFATREVLARWPVTLYRACTPGEQAENGCAFSSRTVYGEAEAAALRAAGWRDSVTAALPEDLQ